MKATKQSFSIPAEMNEWLESEMKRTRRGRSSLIQEGLELLREKKKEENVPPAISGHKSTGLTPGYRGLPKEMLAPPAPAFFKRSRK